MRDTTAQHQAGYPGPSERVYARVRRYPWLVDGTLAVILLAGAANAFGNPAVLPAGLVRHAPPARPLPAASADARG
jgi:hypothetical protein